MVSGACGGDDIRSGAGNSLTLIRRSAKCAAPRRAWRPEVLEGGCFPAAASTGRVPALTYLRGTQGVS